MCRTSVERRTGPCTSATSRKPCLLAALLNLHTFYSYELPTYGRVGGCQRRREHMKTALPELPKSCCCIFSQLFSVPVSVETAPPRARRQTSADPPGLFMPDGSLRDPWHDGPDLCQQKTGVFWRYHDFLEIELVRSRFLVSHRLLFNLTTIRARSESLVSFFTQCSSLF